VDRRTAWQTRILAVARRTRADTNARLGTVDDVRLAYRATSREADKQASPHAQPQC
jgi:hypothetical protein